MATNIANSLLKISLWTIFLLITIKGSTACRFHRDNWRKEEPFSYEEQDTHICTLKDDKELRTENCYDKRIVKCDPGLVGLYPNAKEGKLTVTYELRQSSLEQLDIDLYDCGKEINATTNSGKGILNKNNCVLHSSKFVNIRWSNKTNNIKGNQQCSNNVTVTFDHVYSSSYFVRINTCSADKCIYSCPVEVETDYKQEYLSDSHYKLMYNPFCIYQNSSENNDSRHILQISIMESLLDKPKANLTIINHNDKIDTGIYSCQRERKDPKWHCTQTHGNENFTCNNVVGKNENGVDSPDMHIFYCVDVPQGLYNLTVKYDDLRCRSGTVWTRSPKSDPQKSVCAWASYQGISCERPKSHAVLDSGTTTKKPQ